MQTAMRLVPVFVGCFAGITCAGVRKEFCEWISIDGQSPFTAPQTGYRPFSHSPYPLDLRRLAAVRSIGLVVGMHFVRHVTYLLFSLIFNKLRENTVTRQRFWRGEMKIPRTRSKFLRTGGFRCSPESKAVEGMPMS